MNDIVGKVMVYIFGSILLFIMPILNLMTKQDNTIQTVVNDATVTFIDKARSTGYISGTSYLEFMDRLDATGYVYEVHITHLSKEVLPKEGATGDYSATWDATYEDEIGKELFPGTVNKTDTTYLLKNGDFLKAVVTNKTETMGAKMLNMFGVHTGTTIYESYGGLVGNEQQEG